MSTSIELDLPCDPTQIDETGHPGPSSTKQNIQTASLPAPLSSPAIKKIPSSPEFGRAPTDQAEQKSTSKSFPATRSTTSTPCAAPAYSQPE